MTSLLAAIGLHIIHGDIMCLAPTYAAEYEMLLRDRKRVSFDLQNPADHIRFNLLRKVHGNETIDDLAVDQVGKRAGRQVCGAYFGHADLVIERQETHGNFVFDVVGWRFADHRKGDGRIVWQAFVVGPARVAGGAP